ncbi:MAG: hypothetical protein HYR49_01230 [Gammaproteobacteria bacterium]|nr:hypothetical protein [Gammaproteobacteria bacterium]
MRTALIALMLVWPAAGAAEPVTQPRLAEVLPPELRQSVHHTVEGVELRDGYYTFPVDSEFGPFVAESLSQLRGLIGELEILSQAINQFAQGSQALEPEARGQFSIQADSAVDILARPVDTATDLAGQLGSNINEALRGSPVLITERQRVDFAAAESADPTTSMHKRNIAAQWGFDVYSSNHTVQDFLNTVARARAGGRISAGAPAFIRSKQIPARSVDAAVDAEVWALLKSETAAALADDNRRLLTGMQIPAATIDAFMAHAAFSPRHQTRITRYLAALDRVVNRAAFMESALRSDSERGAVAHENLAMMLLHFHRHVAPLRKLHFGNNALQAIHGDSGILVLLPEDVIIWSADVERALDAVATRVKGGGFRNLDLMTAGAVSPSAQVQIGARGFNLRDHMIF